jgi:hypothetical protein
MRQPNLVVQLQLMKHAYLEQQSDFDFLSMNFVAGMVGHQPDPDSYSLQIAVGLAACGQCKQLACHLAWMPLSLETRS